MATAKTRTKKTTKAAKKRQPKPRSKQGETPEAAGAATTLSPIATGATASGDGASGDGAPSVTSALVLSEREMRVQHKDLGAIAPNQVLTGAFDGVQVINRTKSGVSPFVPILKTPAYSQNSGTLSGYAVEIEDPDSPTGYKHVGSVSKNYLLLSNEEVRELALEIASQSGMAFEESRVFWDGSRFAHVVDFEAREAVEEGDEVGLSLITRSSYDKSWRYECALMGKRFVCDNGALSGEFFARVGFKHLASHKAAGDGPPYEGPKEESWKEVVRQGMTVIRHAPENLDRFVSGLRRLKRAEMTDARLRDVWTALPTIGDGIKGQVMSRYVAHEEPTLYGLFQAGTNVFWHREKLTAGDFANNDAFSTALLRYAEAHLN